MLWASFKGLWPLYRADPTPVVNTAVLPRALKAIGWKPNPRWTMLASEWRFKIESRKAIRAFIQERKRNG